MLVIEGFVPIIFFNDMYCDSNLIFDEISYFSYKYTDFEIQLLFSSWGSDLNFLDKIKYSNVSAKSHWDFNPIRIVN